MSLICSAKAFRALHRVLVCSRFEAYEGCEAKTLGDVMDSAEYLVALLQNHEGRPEEECLAEFRAVLQDIEARFNGYEGLLAVFDNGTQVVLKKEELAALIREVGLGHIEEKLMQAALPSLRLHLHPVDEEAIPIGGTKFGGGADLPPGFEWPVWQGYPESDRPRYPPGEFFTHSGPQEFLLQLRLEDLADYDLGGALPTSGILYFFCATWKAALGWDEADRDCWKVFHYDGDLSRLERRWVAPTGSDWTDQILTCLGIKFEHQWTLPDPNDGEHDELLGALPGDYDEPETDYARYLKLRKLNGQEKHEDGDPIHRLLGLPQIVQSGRMVKQHHVPDHDQEWCLLLQLDTEDVYDTRKPDAVTVHWQLSGRGYFYIPTQALAERNFDAVWVDMQCT